MITTVIIFLLIAQISQIQASCDTVHSITGEFETTCHLNEGSILIVGAEDSLSFTCYTTDPDIFSAIEKANIGAKKDIVFNNCPLPPYPLKNVIDNLGITNIQALNFPYLSNKVNLTITLREDVFQGLTSLTKLVLNGNSLTNLPPNLLRGLTNLSVFECRYNNFTEFPRGFFDGLPQLTHIFITNDGITSLPPDLFRNLANLTLLHIYTNELESIDGNIFDELNTLEFLDMQGNRFQTLPTDLFADLSALSSLYLSKNNFSTLSQGTFTNSSAELIILSDNIQPLTLPNRLFSDLPDLRSLILRNNRITQIPEDTFFGTKNLHNISLAWNQITAVPKNLFRDQSELVKLYLQSNSLSTFPKDFFANLISLEVLDLSNNRFKNISRDMFVGLKKLKELKMTNNGLTYIDSWALREMINLQIVDMSNNNLTLNDGFIHNDMFGIRSPFYPCISLEELILANNSISEIFYDWKVLFIKLKLLDLRYNNFDKMQLNDFHFLSSSVVIDLRYNNISMVYLIDIYNLKMYLGTEPRKSPTTVRISSNPIECDCLALELYNFATQKVSKQAQNFLTFDSDPIICASPPHLRGTMITDLSPSDFQCQYTRDCPDGCDCWLLRHNYEILVNCSSRGLNEVPKILPTNNMFANKTTLDLKNNNITNYPNIILPGYPLVTEYHLSGNKLHYLNASVLNPKLTHLILNNNNFTRMPKEMLTFLRNATSLKQITLHSNPWICDCATKDYLVWMQQSFQLIPHASSVNCSDGQMFYKMTIGDMCPAPLALVLSCAVVAAFGIMVGTLAALYYRYNHAVRVWLYARKWCLWLVTEEELDKGKRYDAFVSFSQKDEDFVVNTLVPRLEKSGLKLCVHYRDWVAGEWIPTQIARSVEASRRTLVVLSPNFLDSVWGRLEFRAAHKQALSEGRARVVMLLFGDLPPSNELDPELRAYISVNTYVKWGDPWFWDKLRYALPHAPLPMKRKKKKKGDNLELIIGNPHLGATTPPCLNSLTNEIFAKTMLQSPKECILPVAS